MLFLCRVTSIGVSLLLLIFCGACSQKWQFATPGPNGRLMAVSGGACPRVKDTGTIDHSVGASPAANRMPPVRLAATGRQLPQSNFPSQVGQVGMAGRPPQWQQVPTGPYVASNYSVREVGPDWQARPHVGGRACPRVNDAAPNHSEGASPVANFSHRPFFHPRTWYQDVCCDYRNYYTCRNARGYLYAVAGASLLANTSLDDDFRDWYQRDARSQESDNFSAFWKTFGEGEYVVPLFLCTAAAGKMLERFPIADAVGEHGYRTTRAYLVGFPPMLFSQHLLGGSRPNEAPHGSMWRPFNDNNAVSGHAFMGAVPFITAAQMSESKLMKFGFYTLSTFPAWSRVNDDAHFASQVCLGWFMAYMACSSVNDTSNPNRCFEVMPLCEPGGAGVMAIWKR